MKAAKSPASKYLRKKNLADRYVSLRLTVIKRFLKAFNIVKKNEVNQA